MRNALLSNPGVRRAPKLFSPENVLKLAVVKELTSRKMGLATLRLVVASLRHGGLGDMSLTGTQLIYSTDGTNWRAFNHPALSDGKPGFPGDINARLCQAIATNKSLIAINIAQLREEIGLPVANGQF